MIDNKLWSTKFTQNKKYIVFYFLRVQKPSFEHSEKLISGWTACVWCQREESYRHKSRSLTPSPHTPWGRTRWLSQKPPRASRTPRGILKWQLPAFKILMQNLCSFTTSELYTALLHGTDIPQTSPSPKHLGWATPNLPTGGAQKWPARDNWLTICQANSQDYLSMNITWGGRYRVCHQRNVVHPEMSFTISSKLGFWE